MDLLYGIGGTPEGVLAAAAIKCTGGQILGRLWPRSDEERNAALEAGYDLDEVLDRDRLVSGEDVFFAATGVTDGEMLDGVHFIGPRGATTESVSMRARSGTVRTIIARHDRSKLREILGERLVLSRADHRRLKLEVGQRAQERVGHDHVDAQLRLVVDPASQPRGDGRVEVDDLGGDHDQRVAVPGPPRGAPP